MDLLKPPRLDKSIVRKYFDRAAKSYDDAAILQEEVLNRLLDRLPYIRHRPETIVDIGCGTGKAIQRLRRHYRGSRIVACDLSLEMLRRARGRYGWLAGKPLVAGDLERLPFADASFDLLFSSLALQWSNDPRITFTEWARVARPGSLLMFASFGPGTLVELAAAWAAIDDYPHVHRFVDMHDIGDAMLAAGFAEPVVDAETRRLEYDSFRGVLADLKQIGATNAGG